MQWCTQVAKVCLTIGCMNQWGDARSLPHLDVPHIQDQTQFQFMCTPRFRDCFLLTPPGAEAILEGIDRRSANASSPPSSIRKKIWQVWWRSTCALVHSTPYSSLGVVQLCPASQFAPTNTAFIILHWYHLTRILQCKYRKVSHPLSMGLN